MSDRKHLRCIYDPGAFPHHLSQFKARCCYCGKRPKIIVPFERFGMMHQTCVMCLRHLFPYPQVHSLRRFFQ
jgi:hypothetical protein